SSASSLGSQTTKSVVQSLFLIIIADALFSIIYSWMKL
ncbi:MAG: ABC transporter permease, partial [Legionella sp.]